MSLAPAAVPNPVIMSIVSFGGGATIRYPSICQLFLASHIGAAVVGHRKTRTLEPLIKSQSQCGAEPNIDKKAPTISKSAYFFFDNGRCMFCPGSGTKQAQPWV